MFNAAYELIPGIKGGGRDIVGSSFNVIVVYFSLSAIILVLSISGFISDTVAVIAYIVLATIIVSVQIFLAERLKKLLGRRVLKLRGASPAIKIMWACFWIAFFLAEYRFLGHSINQLSLLGWSGVLILQLLYVTVLAGRCILDEGLVYDGLVVKWEEIDCFEWKEGSHNFIGFAFTLLVKKKKKAFPNELKISIHNDQREKVDSILKQMGCKQAG